jgi:hypothetical protein
MKRNLLAKLTILSSLILFSGGVFAQEIHQFAGDLALHTEYTATAETANTSSFTKVTDISATSYFQLSGVKIAPYLAVKNIKKSYESVMFDANNQTTVLFKSKTVEYTNSGKTYHLEINGIDQYYNTSDKCLLRGKIEVRCNTVKIGDEKINTIAVYFDQNNHIAFIEIGSTELYLQP